jgi:hypothetical protein
MSEHHNAPIPWNAETRIACAFSFQCPQTWDRLAPTNEATVRHCTTCDRDVQLALTEEDFRHYQEQGGCVAVPVILSDKTGPSTESYIVGGTDPLPYGTPHLKLV